MCLRSEKPFYCFLILSWLSRKCVCLRVRVCALCGVAKQSQHGAASVWPLIMRGMRRRSYCRPLRSHLDMMNGTPWAVGQNNRKPTHTHSCTKGPRTHAHTQTVAHLDGNANRQIDTVIECEADLRSEMQPRATCVHPRTHTHSRARTHTPLF